jgi:transcription-repair coupling factor (superfamily II helicase)
VAWHGLHGATEALALYQAALSATHPLVVVARDVRHLRMLETEIKFFQNSAAALNTHLLPDWECLPYDLFSPHPNITSRRLRLLSSLPEMQQGIVLLTLETLLQRLPPTDFILGQSFSLEVGREIDIDSMRQRLMTSGYRSVGQVMGPGEYAVRGGIFDIFPVGAREPFRLDLFGDVIEKIRIFDPEDQRSSADTEAIRLLPAREFPLTPDAINLFRRKFRHHFEGDPQSQQIYREVSRGNPSPGLDYYFPLFYQKTMTLFDYLPVRRSWVLNGDLSKGCTTFWSELSDRYQQISTGSERKVLKPDHLFLNPLEVERRMETETVVYIAAQHGHQVRYNTGLPDQYLVNTDKDSTYEVLITHLKKTTRRILLVSDSLGRKEVLKEIVENHGFKTADTSWQQFVNLKSKCIHFAVGPIERGLYLPDEGLELIANTQLYGHQVPQERRSQRSARDPQSIIRSLAELNVGDPVVHNEHGIGRYRGLNTLDVASQDTEFLTIEYRDSDLLYVPVMSLDRVDRYIGGRSADELVLNKLGTDDWNRATKRAREKTYDIAVELLDLQAARRSRVGIAMNVPSKEYLLFSSHFPYEETPDQLSVMSEVLSDLESPNPMDRMVCGDVGFGKTEIALRAAFITVYNNKQVAVLVPTTLLAQQHFETFRERFSGTAISIGLLSRFRGSSENKQLIEKLNEGRTDIVIGTHRLLQEDVSFRNLGLLVIDEEHRFGVRQKERLKKLRQSVDILTLTATPIPRSLNMGLSGLRDISVVGTPPKDRLAVKTFVRSWSDTLVREACLRELHRAGQTYFLHNAVNNIHTIADRLSSLIPEASIGIAHGQLPEKELEQVMQNFYNQRFNLLVCTTIIESGIDIPTANTIIIHRADKLGMAQLHQLRGRVGRSNHQAYAYLIVPPPEAMTSDATRRLEAIASLSELGAGFALASHDLEIRGAGQLLGEKQSGSIDEVGFSLYSDYLNRAINELSDHQRPITTTSKSDVIDINLNVTALLPEDYLPDVHERLVYYKRLASAKDQEEVQDLHLEAIDRFGLLPESARSLFRLTRLKISAASIGIVKLHLGQRGGQIKFAPTATIDPLLLVQMFEDSSDIYRMLPDNVIGLTEELTDASQRFEKAERFISWFSTEAGPPYNDNPRQNAS